VVLDAGARFKLWRDQFITKFLTGYGCIIAINIYALIIGAITSNNLEFFENTVLNNMMKIVIIVGGGVSMTRVMALVGNLINAGAGSNELRDSAIAAGSFRRAAIGGALAPFRASRSAINFVRDSKNTGLGTAIGRRLGLRTDRDYNIEKGQMSRAGLGGGSGTANNNTNKNGAGNNLVKNAINGGGNPSGEKKGGGGNPGGNGGNHGGNGNNNPPAGGNMINNAVNNALGNRSKSVDLGNRRGK